MSSYYHKSNKRASSLALILLTTIALCQSGCTSPEWKQSTLSSAQAAGASPATVRKINQSKPLSLGDLVLLKRGGSDEESLMEYIEETESYYLLRTSDIERLQSEGFSADFVDFLLATSDPQKARQAFPIYRDPFDPYYSTGYFWSQGFYGPPRRAWRHFYYQPIW